MSLTEEVFISFKLGLIVRVVATYLDGDITAIGEAAKGLPAAAGDGTDRGFPAAAGDI